MTSEDVRKLDAVHALGPLLYGELWPLHWARLSHRAGYSKTAGSGRAAVSVWKRRKGAPSDGLMDLILAEADQRATSSDQIRAATEAYRKSRIPQAA